MGLQKKEMGGMYNKKLEEKFAEERELSKKELANIYAVCEIVFCVLHLFSVL